MTTDLISKFMSNFVGPFLNHGISGHGCVQVGLTSLHKSASDIPCLATKAIKGGHIVA